MRTKQGIIDFIVYDGYYIKDDDADTIYSHTEETERLWLQGFNQYQKIVKGWKTNDSIYDGVFFDSSGKLYLQYDHDKTERMML